MTEIKERPETLEGVTIKIKTGYGHLYVTCNEDEEGKPFEIFATIGKSGKSTTAKTEAIGRLTSLALRSGIQVEQIIKQLKGIGGEMPVVEKDGVVRSIPDAIAKVLNKHFGTNQNANQDRDLTYEFCPDCGSKLEHDSGCIVCSQCGFSKC